MMHRAPWMIFPPFPRTAYSISSNVEKSIVKPSKP
jgi:hypothetical protein